MHYLHHSLISNTPLVQGKTPDNDYQTSISIPQEANYFAAFRYYEDEPYLETTYFTKFYPLH